MHQLDLARFRKYLEALADPKAEQRGARTFWSRAVRDNARAVADALLMDEEGIPREMIRELTRTQSLPEGIRLDEIEDIFERAEGSGE